MAEVASAYVSLLPSARGFGSKLTQQVGPEVDRAGGKVGGLFSGALKKGAIGVMAAAGGILGTALFKGFQRLDAIDQAKAKLDGLGHSTKSVDRIMANALASVQGTAFGLGEAATTAAGAVAAGVKPGKALERTLSLVGDAATIAGTDMGTMGAIFNKVAASDMIQGDVLAQLGDAGIPILQLLAKEMGVSATAVRDLASKGKIDFATFQSAMEEGLGGAALKSGDTFSGAFKNMQASLGRIGANLLSGIFPQLQGGFLSLTSAMSGFEPIAARVGEVIGTHLAAAMATIVPAISGFVAGMQAGTGAGGLLVAAFQALFAVLGPVAGFLLANKTAVATFAAVLLTAALALKVVTVATALWTAVLSVNPISLVIIAIAALAAGLVMAYKRSETFRNVVDTVWAAMKRVWAVLMQNKQAFLALLGPVGLLAAVLVTAYKKSETFRNIVNTVIGTLRSFASMVGGVVVAAIRAQIAVIGAIISRLVSFGKAVVDRVQDFARFAAGVRAKVAEVVSVIAALPGKVMGYLSGLASQMYNAGVQMVSMLAAGIRAKASDALGALGDLAGKLAALVPGSPVKDGPLRSLNGGHAGREIMSLLAKGITEGGPKVVDALKRTAEDLRSTIDSIKSDMASLADSIAGTFTGNLFEGATAVDFLRNLVGTQGQLSGLTGAFKKLVQWGLDPGFLTQLFQSGNGGLILDLAANRGIAQQSAAVFGQVNSLSSQLGGQVARNEYGDELRKQTNRLERIERAIDRIPRAINGAATAGQRGRVA